MPIQTEQVEIPVVIEEPLSFIGHQLKLKNITLVKQFSPGLPKVTVDSNQIKQVFLNLLLNSIDAMRGGGTITISALQNSAFSSQHSIFHTVIIRMVEL